jgi:phosphoribosylglycinamide formyltransferase-1
MELNLGFIASHNGSNVKAILENIKNGNLITNPKVIISNNPDAGVLELAKINNIPHYCINSKNYPAQFESLGDAILHTLKFHDVNLIILAGYMKLLGEEVYREYRNRILNIHPALLPKYGGKGMYGKYVHEAVLKSNDKETGATVHIATRNYDEGRILAQCKVPRYPKDTIDSLSKRVLRFEHTLYSQVLIDIESGLINLDESF